ncbi:MAG: MerR family transcriptional regulator, partial [Thermodesulfobacteriota bacterium]
MSARLEIPDKVYFRIGEAAGIVGVKPHVLRFWESEFP